MDLTQYLGWKVKNRVALVGIELEGGFFDPSARNVRVSGDSSVFRHDGGGTVKVPYMKAVHPRFVSGEVKPEKPILPLDIKKWMTSNYPDIVDSTCGMHVHMSFRHTRHYELLADPEFQDTLIYYLERWGTSKGIPPDHPFWSRLAGNNQYCLKEFKALGQMAGGGSSHARDSSSSRYTILNYAWHHFGTIECRVLPMFDDVSLGIDAVMTLLDITNAYLVASKSKKLIGKDKGEIVCPLEDVIEETDEVSLGLLMGKGL